MTIQRRTTMAAATPYYAAHVHCGNFDDRTGAGTTNTNAHHAHVMQLRQTPRGSIVVAVAMTPQGQRLDHEHGVENAPCDAGCGTCNAR